MLLSKEESDGKTVLMLAAATGDSDVFEEIAKKIPRAHVSDRGYNALHVCGECIALDRVPGCRVACARHAGGRGGSYKGFSPHVAISRSTRRVRGVLVSMRGVSTYV